MNADDIIYPLENRNNIEKDLLFWIKHFLVYKLSEFGRDKDDLDISFYFRSINHSKSIKDIDTIIKPLRKELKSFYNLAVRLVPFYHLVSKMELDSITDITNSIFYDDFLGKEVGSEKPSTVKNYKSSVKQLFDYIELHNSYYEDDSPYLFNITKDNQGNAVHIARLKQYKKVPIYLNLEELEKLNSEIMTCKDFVKSSYEFQRAKDVLIMKLLIYSGITSSELISLKLSDIKEIRHKNKNYLVLNIHDSNLQDREIPISNRNIIRYYNSYIEVRQKQEHEYLFYDKADSDKQLSPAYISTVVKKFFKHAGIVKARMSAEVLRNTFAITLHNKRSPELYTRELMGYKTEQSLRDLVKYADIEFAKSSDVFENVDKL